MGNQNDFEWMETNGQRLAAQIQGQRPFNNFTRLDGQNMAGTGDGSCLEWGGENMKQLTLPILYPFTEDQQTAMLDALAAIAWPGPQPPGCRCDTCRHAHEAQALRDGTMGDDWREEVARYLWDLPGIYLPTMQGETDIHFQLHAAIREIRFNRKPK